MKRKATEELKRLLEGNENFVKGTPQADNKCLQTLQKFATWQDPRAVILSCSDSRVVPEIIFDVGIGELFVVRSAGIGVGPNTIESIEFAIAKLKVPLLVLLGHDDCGVMKYAQDIYPKEPGSFKSLMRSVYPILEEGEECQNETAKKHTCYIHEYLLQQSSIIREAVERQDLTIVNAHFDFSTGQVNLI